MMTAGGKQNMTIINESGLYSLVLCSNLTDAQKVARDIGRFSVSIRVMELKSRNRHRAG